MTNTKTMIRMTQSGEPRHGVKDAAKLAALRTDMEVNGWTGRPLLAYDDGNGVHYLTGSHRYAAARALDIEIPAYVMDFVHDGGEDYDSHVSECWMCQLIESHDDDDRMTAIRMSGDDDAIELMQAELEAAR
jgi:hypothetical protein